MSTRTMKHGPQQLELALQRQHVPSLYQRHVDAMRGAGYVTHREAARACEVPEERVIRWVFRRLEKMGPSYRAAMRELYGVWFPGWLLPELLAELAAQTADALERDAWTTGVDFGVGPDRTVVR